VGALRSYAEHLRDVRSRLRQREKDARAELWRYGVGRGEGDGRKQVVMREIARVYGELMGAVEEAREDVERLKGK